MNEAMGSTTPVPVRPEGADKRSQVTYDQEYDGDSVYERMDGFNEELGPRIVGQTPGRPHGDSATAFE